jgi:hypothetical protein
MDAKAAQQRLLECGVHDGVVLPFGRKPEDSPGLVAKAAGGNGAAGASSGALALAELHMESRRTGTPLETLLRLRTGHTGVANGWEAVHSAPPGLGELQADVARQAARTLPQHKSLQHGRHIAEAQTLLFELGNERGVKSAHLSLSRDGVSLCQTGDAGDLKLARAFAGALANDQSLSRPARSMAWEAGIYLTRAIAAIAAA